MQIREQSLSVSAAGVSLHAVRHAPIGPPRATVVICNPLFEERKSAHRVLVETARALAGDGLTVLRFDYRGCGDSPGSFEDHAPDDWKADVLAAVSRARADWPLQPVILLGLRFGAALAVVAAKDAGVDGIVLWEPVPDGRAYLHEELRKKLMKEMLTFGRKRSTREQLAAELEAGRAIDFDGYAVTPKLYRQLAAMKLETASRHLACRIAHVTIGPEAQRPAHVPEYPAAPSTPEVHTVAEPPFWNLIGYAACPSLIRTTRDILRKWIRQPEA